MMKANEKLHSLRERWMVNVKILHQFFYLFREKNKNNCGIKEILYAQVFCLVLFKTIFQIRHNPVNIVGASRSFITKMLNWCYKLPKFDCPILFGYCQTHIQWKYIPIQLNANNDDNKRKQKKKNKEWTTSKAQEIQVMVPIISLISREIPNSNKIIEKCFPNEKKGSNRFEFIPPNVNVRDGVEWAQSKIVYNICMNFNQ